MSRSLIILGLLLCGVSQMFARKAGTPPDTNDQIVVVGHLGFNGAEVTSAITGEHWRKNYLYLNAAGKITVVDVTDAQKPKVTSEYAMPASESQAQVVVGNAALVSDTPVTTKAAPRSISVMSFADPAKPALVRQFSNVTGLSTDGRRGLIYIVNQEGLWILSQKPGRDLEQEEQYNRELMYNR